MYVDILMIENIIINFLILNVTSRFSKVRTTKTKLFIGAVIGALYLMIIFYPSLKIFYTLYFKIAISILMIIIAFSPEKFRDFFKILGIFYIISFTFGGAAFSLFYFTGKGSVINGAFYIRDFPLSILITAFAVGYLLIIYCWDYVQTKIINDEIMYNITIKLDDKEVKVNGILDTGNSLKDPISNFPVIVVEYEVLSEILPDNIIQLFSNNNSDIDFNKLCNSIDNTKWILKIRLIPYSSIGKQNGILIGIKPDNVTINSKKYVKEIKEVIIGIYNNKISKDGLYSALLNPEILN